MRKATLRRIISTALCCTVMIPIFHSTAFAETPDFTEKTEWEVLKLTNEKRKDEGLPALSTFSSLCSVAELRAEELKTLFSHTRPDGSDCFTVLDGIQWDSAGENIAYGYPTPEAVVDGWMNSIGHRANIMSDKFKHIGVGYNDGSWVQMFIGGCTTTEISISGVQNELLLSLGDDIDSMGIVLEVSCDMHGKTYLPLENTEYSCETGMIGKSVFNIAYDGKAVSIPVFVNFADVKNGSWYYDSIRFAREKDLFRGMTATTFEPETVMSRAMLVTVIHRLEGSPAVGVKHGFTDVSDGEWYSDAVNWAALNGIVNGVSETEFDPAAPVTREQTAAILHRYATYKGGDVANRGDISRFSDHGDVSNYAVEAISWAVGCGLINGTGVNILEPQGKATRAQIAAILMRYIKE